MLVKQIPADFWTEAAQELFSILQPLVQAALISGFEGGINTLEEFQIAIVNSNIDNEAVEIFASEYSTILSTNITGATRAIAEEKIEVWLNSGEPLSTLEDELAYWFSRSRAEAIAVTEVTRIYAQANVLAWKNNEVAGKKWMDVNDDLVCPICEPLGEMPPVPLDSNGFTTEEGIGLHSPPAHVRCRCWLQPVLEL